MRSFRDLNPYVVGIVSVVLIGAAVGFALLVGLLHLFEDTYTVRAEFPDAAGARTGDEVRVAGVQVGRITDIEADHDTGVVVVSFVVDQGVDIARDATAELALNTLLGSKYLRIGGDVPASGPYLADLPDDERLIPLDRTQIPFDIFELTTTSTKNIQATDNEKLNQLIVSLADVTEGNADDIRALLTGIDQVSGALVARDAELRSLLERADTLSGILAEKDETLARLIDESRRILRFVSDRRDGIGRSLQEGSELTGELQRIVGTHKSFLDTLLDTLHPTLDIVERRQADLDRALAWAGPGAYGLALAGGQGPWTDIYVRSLGPDLPAILSELVPTGGGS